MKLTPENYKIALLPAFFNHTDGERMGTVIRDTCSEFLLNTPKKVLFKVGVKCFPYASEINSIRVCLVKISEMPAGAADDVGGSKKSKSNRSKSSRSRKSEKGETPKEKAQDEPPTKK